MKSIPRFRHTSLYTLERRAGVLWRRWFHNRFVREKAVRRIEINGRSYKRVTLPDSFLARQVVSSISVFASSGLFPRIVAESDHELVVEYVEGESLLGATPDDALVDRVAVFFATLYGAPRRRMALAESGIDAELRADLDFLSDVRVLTPGLHTDLVAAATRLAPAEVWIGHDYLDPLLKNFVARPDGSLVAIDIEDVLPEQLIGLGLAKAILRDLASHRDRLVGGVERATGMPLARDLPFVELCFLARSTKHALLKGREKLVDADAFAPYCATRAVVPDTGEARESGATG